MTADRFRPNIASEDGITDADLAAIAELGGRGYDVRGKSPRQVLELIHRGELGKRSLPQLVKSGTIAYLTRVPAPIGDVLRQAHRARSTNGKRLIEHGWRNRISLPDVSRARWACRSTSPIGAGTRVR